MKENIGCPLIQRKTGIGRRFTPEQLEKLNQQINKGRSQGRLSTVLKEYQDKWLFVGTNGDRLVPGVGVINRKFFVFYANTPFEILEQLHEETFNQVKSNLEPNQKVDSGQVFALEMQKVVDIWQHQEPGVVASVLFA